MLRKISVSELSPGMFVVDSGLSWLEHPYLFSQEGEVKSLAAIRELADAGYTEAFIDTERGSYAQGRSAEPSLAELLARATERPAEPLVPLEEELVAATAVYQDCLCIARNVLETVQAGGELDMGEPTCLIDDVIASAVRNADALVALCKLRRHDAYTFTDRKSVV